jgi:hypothetical protein
MKCPSLATFLLKKKLNPTRSCITLKMTLKRKEEED